MIQQKSKSVLEAWDLTYRSWKILAIKNLMEVEIKEFRGIMEFLEDISLSSSVDQIILMEEHCGNFSFHCL